jgi:hypothetical protein
MRCLGSVAIARCQHEVKSWFFFYDDRQTQALTIFSWRRMLLPWMLAAAFFIGAFGHFNVLFAQEQSGQLITPDSSAMQWGESSMYEIDLFRLLRWVRAHQDTSAKDFLVQTLDLITEADGFARQRDFSTARLILDIALEVTHLRPAVAEVAPSRADTSQEAAPRSSLQWRREVLFGVDLWRQQYEFGLAATDTLFSDGNPFVGLRLSLNHHPTFDINLPKPKLSVFGAAPENRALTFEASALLKSSRDYLSGELEFNARQPLGGGSYWRLQNRLEGASYRRDFDLQYWQNITSALAVAEASKNFRFEVADEFRWRRYRAQNDFYPNYIQNRAAVGVVFNPGYTTRLESRYNYIVQAHDLCPSHDYLEHRVESTVYQNSAAHSSIALENIWRYRIYPNNTAGDTCLNAYQKTYQEEYARADLRLGLIDALTLRLDGDFVLRQYETPSDSVPDFLGVTVNPQLQFNFSAAFQIRAGYLYALRLYENNIIQPQRAAAAGNASLPFDEDYYSHGFTIGIDLIRTDGLIFSVSENFEMRSYPNSTALKSSDWGLYYTDRNLNSLLLFFSWNFHPRWQANALANFDNDHSRVEDRSDSRTTLFSIDLGYSF